MVTRVSVRSGSTGVVRDGQAFTAGDAPPGECARVAVAGETIPPTNGTVIRVDPECELDVVADLLTAGYAVQLYCPWAHGRR